jgi:hypothetical protein
MNQGSSRSGEATLLTHARVVPYLLEHGLLREEQIVAGDVAVEEAVHRNQNYRVASTTGRSLFLKHGVGDDGQRETLGREAAFHALLAGDPRLASLRECCPEVVSFDAAESLLVLELIADAESLASYCERRGGVSLKVARAMGEILAAIHTTFHPLVEAGELDDRLTAEPLFVLSIHEPSVNFLRVASAAGLELLRIVQASEVLCRLVDEVSRGWRSTDVIHADVKWDNWLLDRAGRRGAPTRLRLVDWELARLGDPWWDVGSVVCDFLCLSVLSAPVAADTDAEQVLKNSRFPLERQGAPLAAFWEAYVRRAGVAAEQRSDALRKTMQMAALRMLQTAYERLARSSRIPGTVLYALQLAENTARDPLAVARALFAGTAGRSPEDGNDPL